MSWLLSGKGLASHVRRQASGCVGKAGKISSNLRLGEGAAPAPLSVRAASCRGCVLRCAEHACSGASRRLSLCADAKGIQHLNILSSQTLVSNCCRIHRQESHVPLWSFIQYTIVLCIASSCHDFLRLAQPPTVTPDTLQIAIIGNLRVATQRSRSCRLLPPQADYSSREEATCDHRPTDRRAVYYPWPSARSYCYSCMSELDASLLLCILDVAQALGSEVR